MEVAGKASWGTVLIAENVAADIKDDRPVPDHQRLERCLGGAAATA